MEYTNPKCTHNFKIACDECVYFYSDNENDRPVCHNNDDEEHTPSSTTGDYGPGNPWDAPGMSIRDFL